ncbi:MAG: BadF/BadG/BcrA/BcrD ATPase family protein [Opitutaceae bacterium]|jgi:N-acetylglucosamine kinase-like BadF-type ATPase
MRDILVLGFDCGGTQARVLLAVGDGTVLGMGRAGVSNVNSIGLAAAMAQLRMAVADAWSHAGRPERPVDAAFLGMAGVRASGQRENLQKGLCDAGVVCEGCCIVNNDAEPALAGGLAGRPGIVLIAGTGSYCQGRDAHGYMAHCGGWGWLVDDVGSGFFLGREALKAVSRAVDGRGEATSLLARIPAQAGLSSPDQVPRWLYASASYPSLCAGLARLVTEEAQAGDPVSMRILCDGAAGLAELVRQVAGRLVWDQGVEAVIVGGVGRSGAPYQPLIESAIRSAVPGVQLCSPELPPVAGSVLRAFEHAGVHASSEIIARLRAGCLQLGLL